MPPSKPEVHPRAALIERAEVELVGMLEGWHYRWDLTFAEQIELFGEMVKKRAGAHIRAERGAEVPASNTKYITSRTKCEGLMDMKQKNLCADMEVDPYRCCSRAGEHNGYGIDGPRSFTCDQMGGCSCHD